MTNTVLFNAGFRPTNKVVNTGSPGSQFAAPLAALAGADYRKAAAEQARAQTAQLGQEALKKARIEDTQRLYDLLKAGDVEAAREYWKDRTESGEAAGMDMSHSRDMLNALMGPDPLGVGAQKAKTFLQRAGVMPTDSEALESYLGQQKTLAEIAKIQNEAGKHHKTPEQIERELKVDEGDLVERRRANDLRESEAEEEARKLSSFMQKQLSKAIEGYEVAQTSYRNMEGLVNDWRSLAPEMKSGLSAQWDEWLKEKMGSEDDYTALRKRYNGLRASEATKNLPPGPASDKDIALALSGWLQSTANPQQVALFLNGLVRIERFSAAYNRFKANHIESNRNEEGLLDAWNKRYYSGKIDANGDEIGEVTTAELWEAAEQTGKGISEIMELFEVKE